MEELRPLVLIVHPIPLFPIEGGGSARVLGYIRYLRAKGFRVGLISVPMHAHARAMAEAELDKMWTTGSRARDGRASLRQQLRHHARRLPRPLREGARTVAGLANRNAKSAISRARNPLLDSLTWKVARDHRPIAVISNFVWTARGLDRLEKECLKIIDTHDIQHLRAPLAQAAGYNLSRTVCTREEEVEELRRADVLLAIQPDEAEKLRELVPDRRTIRCEHAYEVAVASWHAPEDSETVLFIGNHYEPNIEGIQSFMRMSWNQIKSARPGARLKICGRVCEALRNAPEGVELLGAVPDLAPHYKEAAVVLNPVPYGTGLKIKTVEALCLGKALVTSRAGVAGLPQEGVLPYVIAEPEAMAEPVLRLLEKREERVALETAALDYARGRFAPEVAYADLLEMLNARVGRSRTSA